MSGLCQLDGKFDTVEEYWSRADLETAHISALESGEQAIELFENDFRSFLRVEGSVVFARTGRDSLRHLLAHFSLYPYGCSLTCFPKAHPSFLSHPRHTCSG